MWGKTRCKSPECCSMHTRHAEGALEQREPDKGILPLSVSRQHQQAYSPFPSTYPPTDCSRSRSTPYLEPPRWCLSDTEQPIRPSSPTSLDPAYSTCISRVHGRRPTGYRRAGDTGVHEQFPGCFEGSTRRGFIALRAASADVLSPGS